MRSCGSWRRVSRVTDRSRQRRGRKAAPSIGAEIARRGWIPDLVLCSAAARAEETWRRLAGSLDGAPELKILRGLYLAPPSRLLEQIRRAPETAERLLVIGHNPGLESFASRLASEDSKARALDRLEAKYPTGALAVFDCPVRSWLALDWQSCSLVAFIQPRDLE